MPATTSPPCQSPFGMKYSSPALTGTRSSPNTNVYDTATRRKKRQVFCALQEERVKNTSLIGAAGVHYAAYKLTKRGLLALPTVRNTPGTDLVVTNLDGSRHANIQVKTTGNSRAVFWPICNKRKFGDLPFGRHDFYLLLRPRRADDPAQEPDKTSEFEGFLLTAQEAKAEMQAHLNFRKKRGRKDNKFPLCIWVDKAKREQAWPENKRGDWKKDKERWRKRWREFEL